MTASPDLLAPTFVRRDLSIEARVRRLLAELDIEPVA